MSKKVRGRGRGGPDPVVRGGMLDAYTESGGPAQSSGMSDSDRFKEGYTKKNKKKGRNDQQRKSESEKQPEPEPEVQEEAPVTDDVVESWEDIEAPAMPVPIKVKQQQRKEEKRNKAKMQQQQKKTPEKAVEDRKTPEKSTDGGEQAHKLTKNFEKMTLENVKSDKNGEVKKDVANSFCSATETRKSKEDTKLVLDKSTDVDTNKKADVIISESSVVEASDKSDADPKNVKADREAKKAAKAAAKAAAANKKKVDNQKQEEVAEATVEDMVQAPPGPKPGADNQPETVAEVPTKSKAELKAERRAKQEAQRAAKAAQSKIGGGKPTEDKKDSLDGGKATKLAKQTTHRVPDDIQADRASVEKKLNKKLASQQVPARTKAQKQVPLFSHLHQYEREMSVTKSLPVAGGNLHPSVLQLGLQFADGEVVGSEGRCVSLLRTLKTVILEHDAVVDNEDVKKELESVLNPNITFIKQCRPLAISMSNGIRYLKRQISSIDRSLKLEEAKNILEERIDSYIHENIELAAEQIAITASTKINDGDVILTYSNSSLIEKVLVDAAASGTKFKVIVSDGRVRNAGRSLAVNLSNAGIPTTYILLTAMPAVLPTVTKVLLGCHAIMANGCVMAHIGTSQVALMSHSAGKPVLVCCETYKFTERVQTDSFVHNELADPDDLVNNDTDNEHLADWRDLGSLCLLNLAYDVTPATFVDAVITEISILPTTSVPVILRLKNSEGHLVE